MAGCAASDPVAGIASGGIYASVALALVMIYQATHHVNFAQGEMATFSTYIALTLINAGFPYWLAFVITVVVSFIIGVADRAHPDAPHERCARAVVCRRVHRPVADHQCQHRLDVRLHDQDFPDTVPRRPAAVQRLRVSATSLVPLRHAAGADRGLSVLPPYQAWPGDARGGVQSGVGPAGRHSCRLDAGAGLGACRRYRRGRRHDGRARSCSWTRI